MKQKLSNFVNNSMFTYRKQVKQAFADDELAIVSAKIQRLALPDNFTQFILYTLSELFNNINEHANAENATVLVTMKNNRCIIKIADDGIGLRQSYLNKQIVPKDDLSAIEYALSGLSTKNLRERGFGLYSVKKLTIALDGNLSILSGKAKAEISKDKMIVKANLRKRKGVVICINTKIRSLDFYKYIE